MKSVEMAVDEMVARLDQAARKAERVVNLTPSETRMSPAAMRLLGSDFSNRYFFNEGHDPLFWEFRGGQEVGDVETAIAPALFAPLAGTTYVNLRPLSGMSAMQSVILAATRPGDTVVSIAPEAGGHYATAAHIERLGRVAVMIGSAAGQPDAEALHRVGSAALVYVDIQNTLHPIDVTGLAEELAAWASPALLHVDCSHTLGLILGGKHPNPLMQGADSYGGSTHKTFPGPHKGVLFTRTEELHDCYRAAQFDFLSSHHFGATLALAVVASQFAVYGPQYASAVVENADRLGQLLEAAGAGVIRADETHVTYTHQVWVDVGPVEQVSAITARLADGGIKINSQLRMPGVEGPLLRIGVNECTLEGAGEESVDLLARYIASAVRGDLVPGDAHERLRATFGPAAWESTQ